MAALTITAANVVAGASARTTLGTAGATITAGQLVYQDPATGFYNLADCDSATAAARSPVGIALHGASNGQPLKILVEGPITIGAALTAGVAYYASPTAGGISPVADLVAGCYPTIVGIATSAAVLDVRLHPAGVSL
jgi:hypothetical protein